ncbi:hypothetical protein VTN00DRAFT_10003 [Thermoascus crustaceus]|uniref:uncharacterized protein n=1 Tax=Thermoascus crustaceus TaxID=5088 RepID=UPI0037446D54
MRVRVNVEDADAEMVCTADAAAAAATEAIASEANKVCRGSRCSLLDAKRPEQRLEECQTQGGHALDRRGIAQPLSGPERSLARPEKRPNPRRNHGRLPPTPSNPCPCGLVVIFPQLAQSLARVKPPSTAGASEKREAGFEVLESRIGSSGFCFPRLLGAESRSDILELWTVETPCLRARPPRFVVEILLSLQLSQRPFLRSSRPVILPPGE